MTGTVPSCLRRRRSLCLLRTISTFALLLLQLSPHAFAQFSGLTSRQTGNLPQMNNPYTLPDGSASQGTQSSAGSNSTQRNSSINSNPSTDSSNDPNNPRRTREDLDRRDRLASLPPPPDTEFQRLVADSIGVRLPIFGASLFTDTPSTFAPVDNIPVSPDYIIGPGDELRIQTFGQVNQQGSFLVNRTGDLSYPDVGTIHVAGVRYSQLQILLKSQLSRVYRNFDLNVNLGQLRSIQVFVVGAARSPGSYTVSSLSTLLNALFASGGPLPQGSLRDIQLLRKDTPTVHFDLYDLLLHGDKSKDIPLAPGDVIFIPPVGSQVAVAGSVNNAAIYEIRGGTTVGQLVELAGGKTSVALGSRVRIERVLEHSMRSIVDVNLALAQDPVLAGGDIVTVDAILDRYSNAVTLRGNVAFPGRYVWHPGMRISDLVRSPEELITRDYYTRRNALGSGLVGYTPQSVRVQQSASPYGNPPSYNAPNQTLQNGGAQGITSSNTGSLQVRGSDASRQADSAAQSGSATTSSTGGGSVGAALTSSNGIFPAVNDIVLSAPDLDWNYAAVERLNPQTLVTKLISFSPSRLFLSNDQKENLELQSGDVITFFSTADLKVPTIQQTRFIRLEGEFVASGIYSVEPGETLRQLLTRAGGFTSDAYLYGSEFTRQSTRRVQQQRLNEYADNLEAQVSIFSASSNARAISDRDAAAANAAAVSARDSIARLRRVVALGRIVLDLKPDSRSIAAVPDLPLEDGDRFVVPRLPSTVSVEGQVYSANAFVFERGRRERDYLHQAGGPDREADRKRTFILRADGSVYSSQYGNVARATIFPGDTIVVPLQLGRLAFLPTLLNVSSVVSQFGLGIAAIRLLQ